MRENFSAKIGTINQSSASRQTSYALHTHASSRSYITSIILLLSEVGKKRCFVSVRKSWNVSPQISSSFANKFSKLLLVEDQKHITLAPVVQTLHSPIHPINHYLVHNYYRQQLHYPLDGDLSCAYRYPPFQQLGLGILCSICMFLSLRF